MTDSVLAEAVDGRIMLTTGYRDKDLVKEIPGTKWDNNERSWWVPLSWSSCLALRGVFGDRLDIGAELAQWAHHERDTRVDPALAYRHLTDTSGPEFLRPYQRVGVGFMTTTRFAVNGDDMGTGKTLQTIASLQRLDLLRWPVFPALVVVPSSVRRQWRREFTKWWPEGPSVSVVDGNITQRRRKIQRVADGRDHVLVINWDNLRRHSRLAPYGSIRLRRCEVCDPVASEGRKQSSCHHCEKELNRIAWGSVTADEAHRAKDPAAQWTRALWSISHQNSVVARWALTGTIVDSDISEAWPIMHFVAPHEYPTKTRFIERYALQSWNMWGGREIVGINPATADEFYGFFDPRFIRRPKRVVLPYLPDKTRVTREVDMTPKQAKTYKSLRDEMLATMDSGDTLMVFNPLVQTARLNQAAASNIDARECSQCTGTGERGDYHMHSPTQASVLCSVCGEREEHPAHELDCRGCSGRGLVYVPVSPSNKIDELVRVLDELGEDQAVVFGVSRKLIEMAAERLDKEEITHVSITGRVPNAIRDLNVTKFQRGEARVCLCVIDAAGEGLDGLQVASTSIYLQRHYSRLKNDQSEDRIHRMGQEADKVLIIDIVTPDTIETDKEVLLAIKEDRFQELVRDEETVRRLLGG